MENKNLWGNLPEYEDIKTPYVILKEQASLLTKLTNGQLEATVTTTSGTGASLIELSIEADLLGYSVVILKVEHRNVILYPLTVTPTLRRKSITCKNQSDLETALEAVFKSKEVRSIISNLLANINAQGR